MENQIETMLVYAEFLVWVSEVDAGFVYAPDTEETIDGYYRMFEGIEAERHVHTSPGIWAEYLEWRRHAEVA